MFPQSQDSHSIINCLVQTAKRLGVKILTGHRLVEITEMADERLQLGFCVSDPADYNGSGIQERKQMLFDRVAITTGGHPKVEHFSHIGGLGHKYCCLIYGRIGSKHSYYGLNYK